MKQAVVIVAASPNRVVAKANAAQLVIISGPHAFDQLGTDGESPAVGEVTADDPGYVALAVRID